MHKTLSKCRLLSLDLDAPSNGVRAIVVGHLNRFLPGLQKSDGPLPSSRFLSLVLTMAHAQPAQDVGVPSTVDLPVLSIDEKAYANEKAADSSDDVIDKVDLGDDNGSSLEKAYEGKQDGVTYVNGEPVISSGADVSNFLLDIRDDGDSAITFRSLFLGTVFAGLGAALSQVRLLCSTRCSEINLNLLPDLYFQAGPSQRLDCFLAAAYLYDRQRLGIGPPPCIVGRRNSTFSPCTCVPFYQPGSLQA